VSNRFYVYTLADPFTGRAFYVGKGKGGRAYDHTDAVRKGRRTGNDRKDDTIAGILSKGSEPTISIVASFEDEQAAFDLEVKLIAETPGLTNIRKGGEGLALSDAERELREARRRDRKTMERLRNWLAVVDTWPNGGTFPGLPNGDERAAELISFVRASLDEAPAY
jgi:hypothetical protein